MRIILGILWTLVCLFKSIEALEQDSMRNRARGWDVVIIYAVVSLILLTLQVGYSGRTKYSQYQAPEGLAPCVVAMLLTIQDKQILVVYEECLQLYMSYYFDQPYKDMIVCIS